MTINLNLVVKIFMPYQLNAKNIFLTYPQCPMPICRVMAGLRSKPNVAYVCVSQEKHQDGKLHLHAFVQFSVAFRTRDPKAFDLDGYHPNVQSCRSITKTLEYVKKDGVFEEFGELCQATKESVSPELVKSQALSLSYPEFLIWSSLNRVMYAKDIWHALRQVDVNTITEYVPKGDHIDPAFYRLFHSQEPIPSTKAIVMVGASGIGKTVIAKGIAKKPALFVSHVDTLKEFKAGYHQSIIFDDVSFTHTPITNQIALCDYQDSRAIHCRHRVAHIPAGIQKIFTCNEDPLEVDHEAIKRRIHLIRCTWGHLAKHIGVRSTFHAEHP